MVNCDPQGEILVKGAARPRLRICGAFVRFADRFGPLPTNHEGAGSLATVVQLE